MGRGDEYECPDCGTSFGFGQGQCPGCGVTMDWDDAEGVEIGVEPAKLVDPRLPRVQDELAPQEPVFTQWGLVFLLLTCLAFVSTILLMRWDTWVRGAAVDSIGDDQRSLIYGGAGATAVFAVLAIWDIFRGQSKPVGFPGGDAGPSR
jgi:hypothetical protein